MLAVCGWQNKHEGEINMNNGMKRMGALMLALVLLVFASGCKGEPSPSSDGSMTDTSYSSDVSG